MPSISSTSGTGGTDTSITCANALEHLPASDLHVLVSTCCGLERVVEEEVAERFAGMPFTDLISACIGAGEGTRWSYLNDHKVWGYGLGILSGKYGFSLRPTSGGALPVLQMLASLRSAEYVSALISFVPGMKEALRTDREAFMSSLEGLVEGGPAGSPAMWHRAFELWKLWKQSIDGCGGAQQAEEGAAPRFKVSCAARASLLLAC